MTLSLYTKISEDKAHYLSSGTKCCWLSLCVRKCPQKEMIPWNGEDELEPRVLDDNDKRKIAYEHAIRVLKRHIQLFSFTGAR